MYQPCYLVPCCQGRPGETKKQIKIFASLSSYHKTGHQPPQTWPFNQSSMSNILHLMFALRQGLPNFNFPIGKMTVVGPLGSSSSQIKSIPRTTDHSLDRGSLHMWRLSLLSSKREEGFCKPNGCCESLVAFSFTIGSTSQMKKSADSFSSIQGDHSHWYNLLLPVEHAGL